MNTDVVISKRGRLRAHLNTNAKKRKQDGVDSTHSEPVQMEMERDQNVEQAGKNLQQKMARQKRKPRRLADTYTTQNLTPRTGQVTIVCDIFWTHFESIMQSFVMDRCGH